MSNPVLESTTPPGPIQAQVGQVVVLHLVGHDDDTRTFTVNQWLEDNEGNKSNIIPTVFQLDDGLKAKASCSDPNVTLTINGFDISVRG